MEDIQVKGSHSRKTVPEDSCFRISLGVHCCFIVIDPEMPTKLLSCLSARGPLLPTSVSCLGHMCTVKPQYE